jgi:hypothetical protein
MVLGSWPSNLLRSARRLCGSSPFDERGDFEPDPLRIREELPGGVVLVAQGAGRASSSLPCPVLERIQSGTC